MKSDKNELKKIVPVFLGLAILIGLLVTLLVVIKEPAQPLLSARNQTICQINRLNLSLDGSGGVVIKDGSRLECNGKIVGDAILKVKG